LNNSKKFFPVALTIAGSDSGGGAGIQADLRTFSALGVFGTSAITALTAQNPSKVAGVMSVTPAFLIAQLESVFSKFAVLSLKTGMLFDSKLISALSEFLGKKSLRTIVVDPVMVSTSGAILLKKNAVADIRNKIFPLADWITPNREEAELILGIKIRNVDDAIEAAKKISGEWNCCCVLKGGHLNSARGRKVDVAVLKDGIFLISAANVDVSGNASHGTGCTFSAALTANFAKGLPPVDALVSAREFVHASLLEKVSIGKNINAMFPPRKKHIGEVKICEIH